MRPETIGDRIRRLRREQGLSLRALEQPGISSAYICRIEAGTRTPSDKALRLLAARLATTALYLETGDPEASCPHCGRAATTPASASSTTAPG